MISEIKSTVPFTSVPLKLKYLGVNLTRVCTNLYEERKANERNKEFHYSMFKCTRTLNIVMISVLLNLICSHCNPNQNSSKLFCGYQ